MKKRILSAAAAAAVVAAAVAAPAMMFGDSASAASAAITVDSVHPNHGTIAGGTTVTISGTFDAAATTTAVTFGGTPGAVITHSATAVTVTDPAHAAGDVSVVVTQTDTASPANGGTSSGIFDYVTLHGAIRSQAYFGRVVDDHLSRISAFNKVDLYPANHTNAQKWVIAPAVLATGGQISLENLGGGTKCLDVFHGGDAVVGAGRNVDLFPCGAGNPAQTWIYNPTTRQLTNPHSGLVLTATSGVAATQLTLQAPGSTGDTWILP
jgi:Ricin-type beta-trefoil lectin domain/IPT/TIG domain